METIASLLSAGEAALRSASVPNAGREASSLLELALGRDRAFIIAHPEYLPDAEDRARYIDHVNRRSNREPFHYIKGTKEFYGLEFDVSPAVLIPRPETEMLVERGIALLAKHDKPRFCEVGVGSGCISISILTKLADATAVGLEISGDAIEMATRNSVKHGVDARFEIRRSDAFDGLSDNEKFDLIVSNPPYVPAAEIDGLQAEVRDHEPLTALTGGADGLSIIRRLAAESPGFLNPGGTLMFEFGIGQADAVEAMFQAEIWPFVRTESDFQGIPRIVSATIHDR